MLPEDSYPMARFSYLKYLAVISKNGQAPLHAKPLASECRKEGALCAEVYCRLTIASCCLEHGETDAAVKEIDRALELALPDRLYAPLAESRNNLGVILDERLSAADKEAVKTVKALDEQATTGWTELNHKLYGIVYTMSLTQQEHMAAKLAGRGLSNADIAARMHVSVNTVKRFIGAAIDKTGAQDRTELAKYIGMERIDE